MGEEDVGNAVFALFDTDDEFVALAGGVDAAQADFVEEAAQAVLGDFGAVFRPLGFHLSDGGFFGFDVEAVFLPKGFQERPDFGRRLAVDNEPALAAVALEADTFDAFQYFGIGRLLDGGCAAFFQIAGADGARTGRQAVEVALVGVVQIRWDFKFDQAVRPALVVELGLFGFAAGAGGKPDECERGNDGFDMGHRVILCDGY